MPTAASDTYSGIKIEPAIAPQLAVMDAYPFVTGSYVKGELLGIVTASKKLAPYNNAAADGTEKAVAICMYDVTVDSSGHLIANDSGSYRGDAPVWIGGYFRTEDLTNLDSGAVADLGRIVRGSSTAGIIRIY